MRSRERANSEQLVSKGSPGYPGRLIQRLGSDAPQSVSIIGSHAPLRGPITAFLCSKEAPGATILKAFDQAAAWRDAGCCVISGFHSPLEKECLAILLRGRQAVALSPARGIGSMRLPAEQRRAVEDGRLTIISPFTPQDRWASADLGRRRNRFIVALPTKSYSALSPLAAALPGSATKFGSGGPPSGSFTGRGHSVGYQKDNAALTFNGNRSDH